MLKYIVVRDITRFLVMYVFVLLGFGFAFHALFQLSPAIAGSVGSATLGSVGSFGSAGLGSVGSSNRSDQPGSDRSDRRNGRTEIIGSVGRRSPGSM